MLESIDAGQADFAGGGSTVNCSACHNGTTAPLATATALDASLIQTNMVNVDPTMTFTLTDQQITDLQAYLATVAGNPTNGEADFAGSGGTVNCSSCHNGTNAALPPDMNESLVGANMANVDTSMSFTLTPQEVADIQAYLATTHQF